MKQNIYDNEDFAKEYNEMRRVNKKGISANDLIEIPTIRKLMPNVSNKSILDLGCGYGENCKYFIDNGAKYVLGIDISKKMIDIANEENSGNNIDYKIIAMEDINNIDKKFDIVVSSLAIHYIEDFDKLCKDVAEILNEKGNFVFSQEHPIGTGTILNSECKDENTIIIGNKKYYLVSDYNRNGKRIVNWNKCEVIKYHRNFSEIINTLIKYFNIEQIVEPIPSEHIINIKEKYINQYDKPYFLFIKASKK